MKLCKRHQENLQKVPKTKVSLSEAVAALKAFKETKFDQTVELVLHLGIDPRQADQALRGSISLPHGIGRSRKVVAFCEGEDAAKAKEAGAVEVGADDLVKKINDGWTDFDVAIATPQMMKIVSKLGRVLGPQGKMPSPKAGTVVTDIPKAVREYAAGKVEYRNDDGGNLHVPVGKMSFDAKKLAENVEAMLAHVRKIRPATTKGAYIKKACLVATMTPAVLLDVQ
ncbi:MAG TPA: 50S ribosomal protein L1 [Phycisphaerales bacterium]|nr:50S ribosomal protein L1 [Phycisphaerales bacterium]